MIPPEFVRSFIQQYRAGLSIILLCIGVLSSLTVISFSREDSVAKEIQVLGANIPFQLGRLNSSLSTIIRRQFQQGVHNLTT